MHPRVLIARKNPVRLLLDSSTNTKMAERIKRDVGQTSICVQDYISELLDNKTHLFSIIVHEEDHN